MTELKNKTKLDIIIEMLQSIEHRIENIEMKLEYMDENSKSVEKNCSKMGKHILLIENVYESVRKPLTYIKNNIDFIMNNDSNELPVIANEQNAISL